jgi:hydroxyacylglutathione hydrolase
VTLERRSQVVGPAGTNVHLIADARTREAIAIDTAIPSLAWVRDELEARGWTLRLIVSTHGHWDHIGDNAAVQAHTGAAIAAHPLDAARLTDPQPMWAPFPIPPSVPAVELA